MANKKVAGQGKGRKGKKVTANVKKAQVRAAPIRRSGGGANKGSQKREKRDFKSTHAHLFEKKPRKFTIGGDLPPRGGKRDMSRVIKWPRYIRIQRQRAILKQRLKVPPPVHQFSETLDKNQAAELYALMRKYRPETRAEKKQRLYAQAEKKAKGKMADQGEKPRVLKFGLKHVTHLIEEKKAKLVVIAHDVDPIELVLWLPALCKKMDVPYCIVKGRARLGAVVHQKTAAVVAFTDVRKGSDDATLAALAGNFKARYNDQPHKSWGGGKLGVKARARIEKLERIAAREEAQKLEAI